MARPRNIDTRPTVDSALALFQRRGFADTSMEDLVQHTGATRHSLYRDFGDKTGLCRAALDLYTERTASPALADLESPDADLATAFATLKELVDTRCLFISTIASGNNPDLSEHLAAHTQRLHTAFRQAIANTARHIDEGEANALAAIIVTFLFGLVGRPLSPYETTSQIDALHTLMRWRL